MPAHIPAESAAEHDEPHNQRLGPHGSLPRTILFWFHLACGVVTGIIILIMSVTGVLLTYDKQIVGWFDAREFSRTLQASGPTLPLDSLLRLAQQGEPTLKMSSVTVSSGAVQPVKVVFARGSAHFIDPRTGIVVRKGESSVRNVFSKVTEWHRWLGVSEGGRETARAMTGASNLVFLLLAVTGFFLWFPRILTWTRVRAVLLFRGGLRGKARDFNWHHVLGIWMLIPLLFVVSSGVVISYRWASNLVFRLAGEAPGGNPSGATGGGERAGGASASREGAPGAPGAPGASAPDSAPAVRYEAYVAAAAAKVPGWQTITIPLPVTAKKPVAVLIDAGRGGKPQLRSTLTLDAVTLREKQWLPFAAQSTGRKARSFLRFVHTGEFFGLIGQTIAGLATLAAVVLVWTGIALSLRRLAAYLRRTGNDRQEARA